MLPSFGGLKRLYLRHFAKPPHDQTLFRLVHQQPIRRLMHLGLGNLERTLRWLEAAQAENPQAAIDLIGVDLFELRGDQKTPSLSLKEAHRLLTSKGVRARLLPGETAGVLTASANTINGVDLLLVSVEQDLQAMQPAWFYVPRMLSPRGRVLIEEAQGKGGDFIWRELSAAELNKLAMRPRRRAA